MSQSSGLTKAYAQQLDAQDELASYREEFYLLPSLYLDGNSLGLMSKRAEKSVMDMMQSWKELGVEGWTTGRHPWFFFSEKLAEMSAALVGAGPEEVIVTGSTTINLHQLAATFYRPVGKRSKVVATELDFPTDIYALQSQMKLHGLDPEEHLVRVASRDGRLIEEEDIIDAMTDEVALVVLPTVLYRSGQLLDIERLTAAAHERGILIGFDGCHSVGAIPHSFSKWGVDFAYWCNYKYVNAGPGSVGSLYVNRKHFGRTPGLAGWFSSKKDKQFDMDHTLEACESAGAYQIGTPHMLSLAPLLGSLEMFQEVSMEKLRTKSLGLTRFMMDLIEVELTDMGFTIANPQQDDRRGGHVSLEHEEAIRICKALKEAGIIPDFRAPNIIRLAPVAFYTTYTEVWESVQILKAIMLEKSYEKFENKREVVA
ncbi:putative kynureninase [Brevibacillus brevis NBRC 100599]|uniref:Kynureninase n=1 Tax=Brevibacillus brevis (strain 47 / JCM 6285 / NBRC 100599) TaxID=358681 RepID=C0Z9D7_BREBN|nr:kynureninase [Brevibacillus brevis]BAH42607.1 putative kynureninase [Brevibacillus brevis NBRC 100599]